MLTYSVDLNTAAVGFHGIEVTVQKSASILEVLTVACELCDITMADVLTHSVSGHTWEAVG